jgi:hypothetical protein
MIYFKKPRHVTQLIAGAFVLASGFACTARQDNMVFSTTFDTGQAWGISEEVVNAACYGTGAGEVSLSGAFTPAGTKCLSVFSNKGGIARSNHVIADYKLFTHGITDSCAYTVSACIDTMADPGQTGPEFSVQNTRLVQGQYRTFTAGIQYVANPWIRNGTGWSVWNNGAWVNFLDLKLERGKWYQFTLAFDFVANRYMSLGIKGPAVDTTVGLGGYSISGEAKGFLEEALVLAVEAENLETACSSTPRVTQYRVFYDNVVFKTPPFDTVQSLRPVKGNYYGIPAKAPYYYNVLGQRINLAGRMQNPLQAVLIAARKDAAGTGYVLWKKVLR